VPNLIDGEGRQHLGQLAEGRAIGTTAPNVIQQKALVLLAVQAESARVFTRLATHLVELPRQQIAHAPTGSHSLHDALGDERPETFVQFIRDSLFAVDTIQHEQILDGKRLDAVGARLFQEPQEVRVLDLAVQGERHLELVGVREVGQAFALTSAFREHPIRALAGAFHQAAACQIVGDEPIAGILPIQDVLWGDAGLEAPRLTISMRRGNWPTKTEPGWR
jgi:hypothetical protein